MTATPQSCKLCIISALLEMLGTERSDLTIELWSFPGERPRVTVPHMIGIVYVCPVQYRAHPGILGNNGDAFSMRGLKRNNSCFKVIIDKSKRDMNSIPKYSSLHQKRNVRIRLYRQRLVWLTEQKSWLTCKASQSLILIYFKGTKPGC